MGWCIPKKIVVPVDFSELSVEALDTALEMSEGKSKVVVLHVLADLSAAETGDLWRTVDQEMRKKHALQALEERLADPKYLEVETHIAIGEPGRTISQFAQDQQAELIILPSHGRTGIQRFLIGSVAERVVRHAHCPVLVLRK